MVSFCFVSRFCSPNTCLVFALIVHVYVSVVSLFCVRDRADVLDAVFSRGFGFLQALRVVSLKIEQLYPKVLNLV